jgi:TatD DNase family protein
VTLDRTALVDTHCHLGDYPDPIGALTAATTAGVHVVAVTRNPGEYRLLRTRLGRRQGVTVAVGLHPIDVASTKPAELARFYRHVTTAEWIGEIGLDYTAAGEQSRRDQRRTLDAVLTELAARPIPATVHSRGAAKETVAALAEANVRVILHWFSGPLGVAEAALADGHAFSINAAMTRSKKGLGLLALLPRERVLLETDGPFVRVGGRTTEPADLSGRMVRELATVWDTTTQDARRCLLDNQFRILTEPEWHQGHTTRANPEALR